MIKSCQYCGRIHNSKHDCGKAPKRKKETTKIDQFRWTKHWQCKREEIRERDNHLCQVCIRLLHGASRQYNCENISVHHALAIATDWDKRLDNDNLVTLCDVHHEMAESGAIPYKEIKAIIDEQEAAGDKGELGI